MRLQTKWLEKAGNWRWVRRPFGAGKQREFKPKEDRPLPPEGKKGRRIDEQA